MDWDELPVEMMKAGVEVEAADAGGNGQAPAEGDRRAVAMHREARHTCGRWRGRHAFERS